MFKIIVHSANSIQNYQMEKKSMIGTAIVLTLLASLALAYKLFSIRLVFIFLMVIAMLGFELYCAKKMVTVTDPVVLNQAYDNGKKFKYINLLFRVLVMVMILGW